MFLFSGDRKEWLNMSGGTLFPHVASFHMMNNRRDHVRAQLTTGGEFDFFAEQAGRVLAWLEGQTEKAAAQLESLIAASEQPVQTTATPAQPRKNTGPVRELQPT